MDEATSTQLEALNARFYAQYGERFSATRRTPWVGWGRVLDGLAGVSAPRVLDVGCGNGRFAAQLSAQNPSASYLGVEPAAPMLAAAPALGSKYRFVRGDLGDVPAGARFDLVCAFGVLHHIPGATKRAAFMRALRAHLADDGLLVVTLWRFDRPRFHRQQVDWTVANAEGGAQIDLTQIEPEDRLLRFQGRGLRYCAVVSDQEAAAWPAHLGVHAEAGFDSDGQSGDLNRYLVFRASRN